MQNAMTIDVEEWFHPEILRGRFHPDEWPSLEKRAGKNVERLMRVLDAVNVRATFFVLGWVAENQPDLVPRLAAEGHEIASHGYAHRMINQQTQKEFATDLRRSVALLRAQSGQPVIGYRAPSFSVVRDTLWAFDVMLDEGIEYDSSIYPVHHDRYGIPGAPRQPYRVCRRGERELWELPPPTLRLLRRTLPAAGGGYLRLFPYAMTALCLKRLNAEGLPGIVYVHPWEFDVEQPRLNLPLLKAIRHYANIGRQQSKLVRLLQEFEFTTCRGILKNFMKKAEPELAAV